MIGASGGNVNSVSIIIPTIDEAGRIGRLLRDLAAQSEPYEVVVADGGSRDGTRAIARRHGATVIDAPRGRGAQLRRGAAAARGDVLLFLHADSRFPPGGLAAILRRLATAPDAPGGNFRLRFDGDEPFSRWLDGFYAWLRRRGLYYGDSGVFVRRAVYDRLGGMPAQALMEDYAFTRALERAGPTLCIKTPPLVTSSRRFRGRHPLRIVGGWLVIHALYHLRLPPGLLARLYYGRAGRVVERTSDA